MSNVTTTKPNPTEYAPFYGGYILLVPAGDIVATLSQQLGDTVALLTIANCI